MRHFVPGGGDAQLVRGTDVAPIFFTGEITEIECTGAVRRGVL